MKLEDKAQLKGGVLMLKYLTLLKFTSEGQKAWLISERAWRKDRRLLSR